MRASLAALASAIDPAIIAFCATQSSEQPHHSPGNTHRVGAGGSLGSASMERKEAIAGENTPLCRKNENRFCGRGGWDEAVRRRQAAGMCPVCRTILSMTTRNAEGCRPTGRARVQTGRPDGRDRRSHRRHALARSATGDQRLTRWHILPRNCPQRFVVSVKQWEHAADADEVEYAACVAVSRRDHQDVLA
jgi:hypothetical protein